jgi:hypothetical protein
MFKILNFCVAGFSKYLHLFDTDSNDIYPDLRLQIPCHLLYNVSAEKSP